MIANWFGKHKRILVGIGAPVTFALLLWFFVVFREHIVCPTYQLTGLYCFGCGSGRAFWSLLHLDFLNALDLNPFATIGFFFVGYYLLGTYLKVVAGRELLPFFQLGHKTIVVILIVILVFGVLRNIPMYPFTILAP